MWEVDGNPLFEAPMMILARLQYDLAERGIARFAKVTEGPKNIMTNCPIHKDGQERTPSFGISTERRGQTPPGTCHCFGCGFVSGLDEMISLCFGYDDGGAYGKRWLIQNFLQVEPENRTDLGIDYRRTEETPTDTYIREAELDSYRYEHPYMQARGLTDEVIEQFDVGYDPKFKLPDGSPMPCLTFPVRTQQGDVLHIARRAVRGKLFHYPEDSIKPVYGLYELAQAGLLEPDIVVYICESILDALRLWTWGLPAVALNGTGKWQQMDQLRKMPNRQFVLCFDGDEAGQHGIERVRNLVGPEKFLTVVAMPEDQDVGNLSEEQFRALERTIETAE